MGLETLKGDNNSYKFNAYREIAYDLSAAMEIMGKRKLAFGEPAIVMYHHPNGDDPQQTLMLMGVGGLNGSNMYTILGEDPASPVTPEPTEDNRVIVTYDVEGNLRSQTQSVMLFSRIFEDEGLNMPFSSIEIDGVKHDNPTVSDYMFDMTLGDHTVKFTLVDPKIIPEGTFYDCVDITSIIVPSTVNTIGDYALNTGNNKLRSVTLNSSEPPEIGENIIPTDTNPHTDIFVPIEYFDTYMSSKFCDQYDVYPNVPINEIANDEIWYFRSGNKPSGNSMESTLIEDYNVSDIYSSVNDRDDGVNELYVVSNTIKNGLGVLKFSGNVVALGSECINDDDVQYVVLPKSFESAYSTAFNLCWNAHIVSYGTMEGYDWKQGLE